VPADLSAVALAKADSLQLKELLDRDFSIIQNRLPQAGADDFTGMNGDDGASAIGMFQEVMTAFDSHDLETCLPQRGNHLTASAAGELGLGYTAMRCTPTNSGIPV
jgi:hypothetical protein